MAAGSDGFDRTVPLPPGLKVAHIKNAIEYIEERADELIDFYYEQANVFSGLIGIIGVRALDSLSPYKKHKHPDVAQQIPRSIAGWETEPAGPPSVGIQGRYAAVGPAVAL